MDIGLIYGFNDHVNQTVIDQDVGSLGDVVGKVVIGDLNLMLVTHDLSGGQSEFLTFLENNLAFLEEAETNLRSLGIKHCRDGSLHLFTNFLQKSESVFLLLMFTM